MIHLKLKKHYIVIQLHFLMFIVKLRNKSENFSIINKQLKRV